MTLDDWLEEHWTGTIHKLHLDAGVSLPVLARARKGNANLANAIKLHDFTKKLVPISSMTTEEVPVYLEPPPPRRRSSRKARRTRARVA
jgi:hypothetical protein